MSSDQLTGAQIGAVQHILEQALSSRILRTWWDGDMMAQVFELSYDDVVHQVAIAAAFFADCPDYAAGLRESELVDYLREMHAQGMRFIIRWQGGDVHIRCKRL